MVRRYDEPIEVRAGAAHPRNPGAGAAGDATSVGTTTPVDEPLAGDAIVPESFIWRGRLFVVRAVQDRWRERRAWWREEAVTGRTCGPGDGRDAPGGECASATERTVWRVEAGAGATGATGVFDLGSDAADGARGPWLLLRAQD